MSLSLAAAAVRGILLDIEGTTTPIDFVYGVLFPFARARVREHLSAHASSDDLRADLALLREEHAADVARGLSPPPWLEDPAEVLLEEAAAYVHWLMDQDRKSPALKALQGKIWEQGYRSGELRGRVFEDVPAALERWQRARIDVRIFSSGSALAQELLFAHSEAGDLRRFLSGYFDTRIGPKTSPESYLRIADRFGLLPAQILFISDVTAELDACLAAGMRGLLSARPGNRPPPAGHGYTIIRSFAEITD